MNVNQITDLLNAHDIKPSYQRIKVYEVLIHRDQHPTAEMIYQDLVDTIPTLSKTTIYNTLRKFVEKGIVKVVAVDNNEVLYDPVLEEHGHFKCRICGRMYNFDISDDDTVPQNLDGFLIEQRHILLKGICKACNKRLLS